MKDIPIRKMREIPLHKAKDKVCRTTISVSGSLRKRMLKHPEVV